MNTASMTARRLLLSAILIPGLTLGAIAAFGGDNSPWTPERLDLGFELASVQVNAPAPAPVPAPVVAPQPAQPAPTVGPPVPTAGAGAGVPNTPAEPTGPVGHITWAEGENLHEFGEVVQGDSRSHTFQIRNEGEGDLVIHQIRPSCGCTVAQTSIVGADGTLTPYAMGTPVAPGTTLALASTLNTAGKRGAVQSAINIYSNDARNLVSLQLKAQVTPVLAIEPNHLNFQQLSSNDEVQGVMTITSGVVDAFSLEIIDPERIPEALDIQLVPIEPTAEGKVGTWEVRVNLGPGTPEGAFSHGLRLASDIHLPETATQHLHNLPEGQEAPAHSDVHQLNAYVMAQVTGMIAANPYYISFGLVRPGQVVTRSVRITNNDEAFSFAEPSISIRGYQGDFEYPDALTTSVRRVEGNDAWDVEVTLDGLPEDLNSSFRGMVQIEVGHATKPVVEIPFSGVCRSGVQAPAPAAGGGGE